MAGATLVFYDADCGLCSTMARWVHRIDRSGRVRTVPLGSGEADAYLGDLDARARAASVHVVTPGGERTSAGVAVLRLLEAVPITAGAARVLDHREAGREAVERLYRLLVRVRDGLAGDRPLTRPAGTSGPSGSS
jgi:predicted DCC family thiol-disulfide oxidoreductase YuxK